MVSFCVVCIKIKKLENHYNVGEIVKTAEDIAVKNLPLVRLQIYRYENGGRILQSLEKTKGMHDSRSYQRTQMQKIVLVVRKFIIKRLGWTVV